MLRCTPIVRTTGGSWRSAGPAVPSDAAIAGNEQAVEAQLRALFDAGATDVYVYVHGAGEDRRASWKRGIDLLRQLAGQSC